MWDPPDARRDGLRTDLYQLTMAAGMHAAGLDDGREATFELYTRRLHAKRGYWVACGLEPALDYLEGFGFSGAQVDWLRALPLMRGVPASFWERLRALRFTGEVWALAEGAPVFPDEPILQVTAPAVEAQLLETYLLALVNFQTLIASKAARVQQACRGKKFVDFGTRRAHGPEAGELAARAAYVAGAVGTSNVEAGMRLGIPVLGTFAHAWVMQFDDEDEAFRRYAEVFPDHTTLLIDTYDTVAAARRIVRDGLRCNAVRLDSGELGALSREVRRVLDEGGRPEVQIVASGDLNEDKIHMLEHDGAAIDVYGVGTELVTSKDCPSLGGVYKVVETRRGDVVRHPVKLSQEKGSWPGRKQVWRLPAPDGGHASDWIALAHEPGPAGARPLLERVAAGGRRTRPAPALADVRARCVDDVGRLSASVRDVTAPGVYKVEKSFEVGDLAARAREDALARAAAREQAGGGA